MWAPLLPTSYEFLNRFLLFSYCLHKVLIYLFGCTDFP